MMLKVFVVHRGSSRGAVDELLRDISRRKTPEVSALVLDGHKANDWRKKAEEGIHDSEVVLIFNPEDCQDSTNAQWEIDTAKKMGKEFIEYSESEPVEKIVSRLREAYDFDREFEGRFSRLSSDKKLAFEQYSIMVNTSEELIRRRQLTNGFFITIIGGLLAAIGFALSEGLLDGMSSSVLLVPILFGVLLCRSWARLIKNYGELNRGKFRVIKRIEEDLAVEMFAAEWAALGKGVRKDKYQPFTESEREVPKLFGLLLGFMGIVVAYGALAEPVGGVFHFWSTHGAVFVGE